MVAKGVVVLTGVAVALVGVGEAGFADATGGSTGCGLGSSDLGVSEVRLESGSVVVLLVTAAGSAVNPVPVTSSVVAVSSLVTDFSDETVVTSSVVTVGFEATVVVGDVLGGIAAAEQN